MLFRSIVSILGIGLQQTLIAICLTAWTKYAYLMRSMTMQLKNEPYIQSSKMYGNSFWTTLKNYYFPSLFPQILTTMSFDISTIIMEIAGLSFVGLGAQAPSPEWGAMINDGRLVRLVPIPKLVLNRSLKYWCNAHERSMSKPSEKVSILVRLSILSFL